MKALTVYKASAGSGKTFTLATEYIKLLIGNPQCYRNILAVTFTNKATEEMKMRILSQLYGIAQGLDDSDDYLKAVCRTLPLEPKEVRRRAATALNLLLHHYSNFRVETIDSFFQRVLRNLARELDLTANLKIELNDNEVEELAVDELIASLRMDDDLMKWILDYIHDNIKDDKGWNVISPLKTFGRTIFRDFYKTKSKDLTEKTADSDFFRQYIKDIKAEADKAKSFFKKVADDFFNTLSDNGLEVSDFSRGTGGVCGFFIKLRDMNALDKAVGKLVTDAALDAEKWVTKTNKDRARIIPIVNSQLLPLLNNALRDFDNYYKTYLSAITTLKHLNELRLLGSIERKVRELNDDAGRFLLSDTQQLLHSLVKDSDSPFIFEKIGSILEHIMIDEFQDTSTVQWANFKVLLNECMSHNDSSNLIVGDVKQSIYRWRSGDWRLLNNIKDEFNNPEETIDITTLDTNYRSQGNVVEFNNHFFIEAADIECKNMDEYCPMMSMQLSTAYADVEQKYKEKNTGNGEVIVEMLPKNSDDEDMFRAIEGYIDSLTADGVPLSSIAILVRRNDDIKTIASHFSTERPDFHIISDEAFLLSASVAVRIIVNALQLLTRPEDMLTMATLAKLYQQGVVAPGLTDNDLLLTGEPLNALLPDEYTANMEKLAAMPLFELVETIYRIFHLNEIEGEAAYICTFFDHLTDYMSGSTGKISGFIDEWNASICRKTISVSAQDGIRIISIHKSKGLEFDNVIIPFCDWPNEIGGNQLWCSPEVEPFKRLPFLAVDYKQELQNTIYADDYNLEKSQNVVDNLNLLYVAFTRAVNNLYVISKRDQSAARRANLIEKTLPQVAAKLDGAILEGEGDKNAVLTFSFGKRYIGKPKDDEKSDNVLRQPSKPVKVKIEVCESKVEFRQSNKSHDFISGEDDEESNGYLKLGCILHNVFSTIRSSEDVDGVLLQLEQDGLLYDESFSKERIVNMLRKRLTHPKVAEWFDKGNRLFNECTILYVNPDTGKVEEQRPDRVIQNDHGTTVIDFKFGRPRDSYHDQVRGYMQLLTDMGHNNVKGYLWYVYSNKIEEVKEVKELMS
ncbi:MAG: UvrD-helicase domain-containing protein [Prevotella sp.]